MVGLSLCQETTDETSENYLDERWTVKRLNRFLCDQGTNTFMELHAAR